MKKYLTVFELSFQNEFTYRLNFILWRFRNVLRVLMVFFLWNSVFSQNAMAFGYSRQQMMGYVFLVLMVSTLVTSAPSNDNVGGEIGSGDLSNYLVKPINYLRYWLTRDWSSKLLNILFSVVEVAVLYALFRPEIILSTSWINIVIGLGMCVMAALIYFLITKMAIFVAFWTPENTWGLMFILLVLMEILSGWIFPLDILPSWAYTLLQFTPFPYLIYFPIGILVGHFSSLTEIVKIVLQTSAWLIVSYVATVKLWRRGLKAYSASGK